MSRKRASMRKIKEVLRLASFPHMTERKIVLGANVPKTTVRDYLSRARLAGLTWLEAEAMDETRLEQQLFPIGDEPRTKKPLPDWQYVHQELRRPHVTLQLLWEEYRSTHVDGYSYSQFCELYRIFVGTLDLSMRQTHTPGEKVFVDYSGTCIPVIDPHTGEERMAEVFVAVHGASSYAYAEASWSQRLPDWIGAHTRALHFFGGVPAAIVPDNLKSGVKDPLFYDPEINPTYQQWAEYYDVAILPARSRKPKDKAKVEAGVSFAQRWIIAVLRNRRFFSLAELNTAITEQLDRLNSRPYRKMEGTRASLFAALDLPALRPLPAQPYEYAEWKKVRVNIDYHIEFDRHYYSVPYRLTRQRVEVRATTHTIEILHRGTRVAVHARSDHKHRHTTITEHMPEAHRAQVEWTPERLQSWGRKTGPDIAAVFIAIMEKKQHPEQGYRSCLGIMRLEKKVGPERLNAACKRALAIGSPSYRSVRTILENKQDEHPLPENLTQLRIIRHENVRGAAYYRDDLREVEQNTEGPHVAASHA